MLRVLACLTTEHDWRLVAVAGIVCLLASLAAVSLLHRARATAGQVRLAWIVTAATATGIGIWATHFVAMLAYRPGLAAGYDVGLTLLSLLAAAGLTGAGIWLAVHGPFRRAAAAGGALVGGGVACMHFLGLWALDLPGHLTLSPDLVAASIVLAAAFGTLALVLATRGEDAWSTAAAAGLLALAIVSHHFTAMGAVEIVRDATRVISPFSLSPGSMAAAIAAAAVAVLGMCLVGAWTDRRSDDRMREQLVRLDAALNNMCQGLCMFDAQARLVVCNRRYLDLYGLSSERVRPGAGLRYLLEQRRASGTFSGDADAYIVALLQTIKAGRTASTVAELDDGRVIEVVNQPMDGGGWVATHEDITEQRRAQRALEQTQDFLNTVIENVPTTLVVKDAKTHRYVLVNRAGEALFGLSRDEMIGKSVYDFFPRQEADMITASEEDLLRSGRQVAIEEHPLPTPRHGTRLVNSKRLTLRDRDGEPRYLLGLVEDITERKRAEARIAHMAHHDALTNLPNRTAFDECLAGTLERAAAENARFAVLCTDFDRFKEVNDVFGHAVGDALLREIAHRLQKAAEGAFVARIGGDEFTLIAEGPQPEAARSLAERIRSVVHSEIVVDGHRLNVGVTVGVAVFPSDGNDAATLLGNADAALYRAKAEARGSVRFFEADMDRCLRDRRAMRHELASAIERHELRMHYQPQALIGGEVVGLEALVRWMHPTRGLVAPGEFIPVAEESGLIIALGEWILREACREAAGWPRPLQIAVNLSPVQFQHGDLVALVHAILLETGLAPGRLELEIGEGALIGDFARSLAMLRRLKALGVRVAMDDFGSGYSSLSCLQSFPFDKIKIDRAFISKLDGSPQSAAIVRAVIGFGRGLDLPVVAEGVETRAQLAFLSQEACDEVQGFLVGHPLPIERYAVLVGRDAQDRNVATG